MSNKEQLYQFLVAKGLELSGPIVHYSDDLDYIAFVKVSVDQTGVQSPGSKALSQIATLAEQNGYKVSIIPVGGDGSELDASLKKLLLRKFGTKIGDSFLSLTNQRADVWIDPKETLAEEEQDTIRNTVFEFSHLFGLDVAHVNFTDSKNIPSPTAILRTLRTKSPCHLEQLGNLLVQRGFTVPSATWLSHALDKLRKAGLLVRSSNGEFFLSFDGLSGLGTTKGRQSPDVLRALDFARREV